MSPATISFLLTDEEGDSADVQLLFRGGGAPGSAFRPITLAPGSPQLSAVPSNASLPYHVDWDFAADLGDASYHGGIELQLLVENGISPPILDGVSQGNDSPVISTETPQGEVDGIVPVHLHCSDSSSDVVSIRAEFDIQGDDPDQGWLLARPAGLSPSATTPQFAFELVVASAQGTDLVFFWDTEYPTQLPQLEQDVILRFTAVDQSAVGSPALTDSFRVDNNAQPTVQIQEGVFLMDSDATRGIAVPFVLTDEESDLVTVVFQWAYEGAPFPDLPQSPSEVLEILLSPSLRRQYQICSQYPHEYEGRPVQVDATHLGLTELSTELSFLAQTIPATGRDLELVRPSAELLSVTNNWPTNPLARPCAALPTEDGASALVLDEPFPGDWRLIEIRLADGTPERTVAVGVGTPTALCFERDDRTVLVAAADPIWTVQRVDLETGSTSVLVDATNGPVEQGSVRGIASIGDGAAVLTVGSSLVRVAWPAAAPPQASSVHADLKTPWGVVVDPLRSGWVFVAENDGAGPTGPGRVVSIELSSHAVRPVVIEPNPKDGRAFSRPRGIACLRGGSRLLAVCESNQRPGQVELRGVELGRADSSAAYVLGPALGAEAAAVTAGSDDALIVTSSHSARLDVAGGVLSSCVIESLDPSSGIVTLEHPLDPELDPRTRWRVRFKPMEVPRFTSSPVGQEQRFVWNSADVPAMPTLIRATPLDSDVGAHSTTSPAKKLEPLFEPTPTVLGGPGQTDALMDVLACDLDRDGDMDLATANAYSPQGFSNVLTVFWQTSPSVFDPRPTVLGGPAWMSNPTVLEATDFDLDGDLDLASANTQSHTITVFWQAAAGVFSSVPTVVGGPGVTPFPDLLKSADVDGDALPDLVTVNGNNQSFVLFWQDTPGQFTTSPTILPTQAVSAWPSSLELADLDSNGLLDLVFGEASVFCVFWQKAPRVFDPTPTVISDWAIIVPGHLDLADLDGDGDLDLMTTTIDDTLAVLWQVAPGVYDPTPDTLGGLGSGWFPGGVEAADFEHDGLLDLLTWNWSDTLTVFRQTARGFFEQEPLVVGGPGGLNWLRDAGAADIDGDGDLDVYSITANSKTLNVFWQGGVGKYNPVPALIGAYDITEPRSARAGDLDQDGDLDLVTEDKLLNLKVFWQTSPGLFDPEPLVVGSGAVSNEPCSVQAADLDADGDLDLLCANRASSILTVFTQTAPGLFGDPPTVLGSQSLTQWPECAIAVDLDDDGKVDVVSANTGSNTLTVFWQEAPGQFSALPTTLGNSAITEWPRSVRTGDLDADGDLDLVSANDASNTLTVFWQVTPRSFGPTPAILGGPGVTDNPSFVEALDVDDDGDCDLISINGYDDTVLVFWQQEPGVFGSTPTALNGSGAFKAPVVVHGADLDSDGDLDLVSANFFNHTLTVFWQASPAVFLPTPTIVGGFGVISNPQSVHAVDLDSDGDIDLVSAVTGCLAAFWGGR